MVVVVVVTGREKQANPRSNKDGGDGGGDRAADYVAYIDREETSDRFKE